MSCSGVHCAGCAGGAGVPVVLMTGVFGLAWVAEHLVEVAVVASACGALAVAAVVALVRWCDRREVRHAAKHPLLVTRPDAIPLTVTAAPQVTQGTAVPAVEQHVHFHFDPADRTAAALIRQVLTVAPSAREEIVP